LLQKYRQVYRDRYPEDYKRLFPEGEPEWVLSSLLEAQVERKEMEPMRIESEGQDEIQSLLRPLEQALRGRQEAIDRLTQENRKLQAELAVLQAQERKSADKELMFVHTSPDFHHSVYGRRVTSIKDTIEAMLQRAQHSIRVSTLQIDIFADDLIALKRRNPKLEITVLTRAKAQGDRKGIATRAIPRMKNAGIKVQTDQELLHSRMLVIDDREVLVSSADLDVTQMQLEFNAGIWSNSSDVVCEAISYFDNILNARRQQP
jgi:phosphatidylserine/phosphatidylglycerophosphate/cardiolipin synthase-like enzyme